MKHELGVSLSAPDSADLGFEAFYSFASGRNDFGLRVGFLDDNDTDLVVGGRSGDSFVPYLQPVLVPTFSEGDSELEFALGPGLDVRLTRRFDLRVSGAVGDLEGFAVSFAWVR